MKNILGVLIAVSMLVASHGMLSADTVKDKQSKRIRKNSQDKRDKSDKKGKQGKRDKGDQSKEKKHGPKERLKDLLANPKPSDAGWNTNVQSLLDHIKKNNPDAAAKFQSQYDAIKGGKVSASSSSSSSDDFDGSDF